MTSAVTFATVPKLWPESTIVCIASGPSLTQEDVDRCRDRARVIVINDGYRRAPWADVLYASDGSWWDVHQGVPAFTGLKYTIAPRPNPKAPWLKWDEIRVLRNTGVSGLELKPSGLRTGLNSGHQAINLAVHLGARRIVLLGYDIQLGPSGEKHWFGKHPKSLTQAMNFTVWKRELGTLVEPLTRLGISVVNCSRRTALTCFPQASLADVLCCEVAA